MKKVVLCVLAMSASIFAADEYNTGLGSVELGGGGGVARFSGGMVKPVAYTRLGTSLNRVLTTYGEFAYLPVESASINTLGVRVSASSRVISYGGGMQFQVPTGTRITPYATMGIGAMNVGASGSISGIGSFGISETLAALNFGGGTKIFLTPKLGVDVSVRAFRTTESGAAIVPVGTVGVFYQFNKR